MVVTDRRCLICGGVSCRPVFEEFGIPIVRCRDCRHVFSTFDGDLHYDGFWGEEVADSEHAYWNAARAPMYRDFLKRFVAGRSGRLLDMGCGLGFFVKAVAVHPRWEAHGCEVSPAAVRYAREFLDLRNVVCSRLDEADWPHGFFNLVTMWDVIDHIPHPDSLLKRCRELLAPGGVCFIRVPNILMHLPRARLKKLVWGMRSDITYLQARDHCHYYSPATIRRLLERNGFSDVRFVHLPPVDSVARHRRPLGQLARKGWLAAVRGLAIGTRERVNMDNLFVLARR
jgi:SAM-dependent methyltransferase